MFKSIPERATCKNLVLVIILLGLVFTPGLTHSRNIIGKAEVTLVTGLSSLQRKGMADVRALREGDLIQLGDHVFTKENSRIEIRLPDNSILRFGEKTTFKLESAFFNKRIQERKINITMIIGKVWANVTPLTKGIGHFIISTKNVVAGVERTVLRMGVYRNFSAEIKVYKGEITVWNRKKEKPSQTQGNTVKPLDPQPLKPSKQKDWKHSVKSMHQIVIWKDGSATRPFRFSSKSDSNIWVLWNQKLDEKIGIRQ